MKAFLTESPGGWDATRLAEVSSATDDGQRVLVGIRTVGLNPADAFQIEGRYPGGPKPPFIAGRDAAGVVLKSEHGGRWKAGDKVVVLQSSTTDLKNGTLCEEQRIAGDNLATLPESWSFAEGAAAPLTYLTAWKASTARPPSPQNKWS